MRLTVCGSAGTHAGPARACSSYLVEAAGRRVLLDCGNGSLANLQQRVDVADLDAVVLSHLHPDHVADLYSLYYALRFHPRGERSLAVHAPGGARAHLGQLLGDGSREAFGEVLRFVEVAAGDTVEVGEVRIDLHAAHHPVEAFAMRVSAHGRVLAYTGDTAYASSVVACARGADVLLAEASWQERQRPLPEGIHMTGAEAGRLAADAGAGRLVLTHIVPTNDPEVTVAEAAAAFDGEVLAATDLLEIDL